LPKTAKEIGLSHASPPSKTQKRSRRKMSQERVMLLFTLFFIVGIIILSFLPENNSARGAVMGVYSIAVFWAYFKFGS
jgi:4-hydroxybenzoate polyprenyltransferase